MRRVLRLPLSSRSAQTLQQRQTQILQKHQAKTLKVEAEWKQARRNKPLQEAVALLKTMAGTGERCMYCCHSHGTDIEHFWPKSRYPDKMFQWENMLFCCTECGRFKGAEFPFDQQGQPAIVDPSAENPWSFLDFDPLTGNIVPRFDLQLNGYSFKGQHTVRLLQLDQREALAEEYRKTFRRLRKVIEQAIENPPMTVQTLWDELCAQDDHGLLGWFFDGIGTMFEPFAQFIAQYPHLWAECSHKYAETIAQPLLPSPNQQHQPAQPAQSGTTAIVSMGANP